MFIEIGVLLYFVITMLSMPLCGNNKYVKIFVYNWYGITVIYCMGLMIIDMVIRWIY